MFIAQFTLVMCREVTFALSSCKLLSGFFIVHVDVTHSTVTIAGFWWHLIMLAVESFALVPAMFVIVLANYMKLTS